MSIECVQLLTRNKMTTHIETGNIFFNNQNSRESIYEFFYAQQNYKKKLIDVNLTFGADYDSYISNYLMRMKGTEGDKYDMLTNKNLEFFVFIFANAKALQFIELDIQLNQKMN